MIKPRLVIRFLLIFFFTYIVLLVSQTGKDVYARFFCTIGSKVFHYFDEKGIAVLELQKGKDNIKLMVSSTDNIKPEGIGWYMFNRSSDHIGYWHTIFLLSLIIATPLSWKKKFFALGAGFILISCVVFIRLRTIIIYCCAITPQIGLYQDAAKKESAIFWNTYVGTAYSHFYSVCILIWLMVCIGKNEWQQLNGLMTEQPLAKQQPEGKVVKKKKFR